MKAARPLLLAGALGVAPLLSGCVAAAIPLLAAGGVAQSQRSDHRPAPAEAGEARVSVDLSPPADAAGPGKTTVVRTQTLADGTRVEVMAGPLGNSPANGAAPLTPATSSATPSAPAVPASEAPDGRTLGDDTLVPLTGAVLPPPAVSGDESAYQALLDFGERQAQAPVVGSERRSAILANPLDLRPETKECSIHPAAVLVDLDPAGATLDPVVAVHADPRLAEALATLRARGVAIGWISANSADRAGDVRRVLVESGLDKDGRDELVLLRYPQERKQTRRADFAGEFCLVAIAGDNRGDFDELYDYIKNPFLAAPLDALLGNGWFLIPQPLT
jgi:hypothetical protein